MEGNGMEDIELTPNIDEDADVEQVVDVVGATLDRFLDAANVDMVFGEPIEYGNSLIIPSAELVAGLGFGVGSGSCSSPKEELKAGEEQREDTNTGGSGGGGGGGGGRILSRPVAVIVASPDGVVVKPVIDTTKIALTAITAAGFMFGVFVRMRRGRR
jgi:uncharacterized spore protein YtfJ